MGNICVAGPSVTADTKLTTSDWFEKNLWGPLQQNGGTSLPRQLLEKVFFSGCIGLATLTTAGQFKPRDPKTGEVLNIPLPDVRKGFSDFDERAKVSGKAEQEQSDKSGGHDHFRAGSEVADIRPALLQQNETYPTAEPKKGKDGSYDLSGNDALLTIADRSKPGATNFDFFTHSEPGDPWYNADRPWLHANEGGKEKMKLMATDLDGIKAERAKNNSDFDKLFFFVAPERQFPKAKK